MSRHPNGSCARECVRQPGGHPHAHQHAPGPLIPGGVLVVRYRRLEDACQLELPAWMVESVTPITTAPEVSLSPIWALTRPSPPMTTLESS